MVTLDRVLRNLGTGVLKAYNCSANGTIRRDMINNMIVLINSGIQQLYSQFFLRKVVKNITLVDGVTDYFINDDNKLIEVLSVSVEGESVLFVAFDNENIQIPSGYTGTMQVECSYKPLEIAMYTESQLDVLDTTAVSIDLPTMYLPALYYFVAQQWTIGFESGAGVKSPFHVGNNFQQLYDNEVVRLQLKGYEADVSLEHDKFNENGFI